MNAGRPPSCKCERQNVRRVRPKISAKIFAHLGLRELGEILGQLLLGVPPGEIGVALREASLGQRLHHFGFRKRFRQKDRIGKFRAHARDQIFPERQPVSCADYRPEKCERRAPPRRE